MKKFKSVVYRVKGVFPNQSMLDDLKYFLNTQAQHGWEINSVQLTEPQFFLIVMSQNISTGDEILTENGTSLLVE